MKSLVLWIFLLAVSPLLAQDAPVYRLKSNDTVRLTVFRESELTTTEQLTAAGEVSFPLIGSVRLLGLSLKEAEKLVTEKYDADYLVSPSLSINVLKAADEIISVLGAVNNPGQQNIPVNTTLDLVTAIDSAGGLAAHGDPKRVELKRGDETLTFQLDKLRSSSAQQVVLKHGDRINIPASPFANKSVTILGEVKTPGSVPFPISGKMSLDVLVATSGGLTEVADPARLTIKRNGKVYSGSLGSQQALVPGDLVTIPPSKFVGKTVTLTGRVGRVGDVPFPLDGRLDLLKAINLAGGFDRLANRSKVKIIRQVGGREQTYGPYDCKAMERGTRENIALQPGDRIHVAERVF